MPQRLMVLNIWQAPHSEVPLTYHKSHFSTVVVPIYSLQTTLCGLKIVIYRSDQSTRYKDVLRTSNLPEQPQATIPLGKVTCFTAGGEALINNKQQKYL